MSIGAGYYQSSEYDYHVKVIKYKLEYTYDWYIDIALDVFEKMEPEKIKLQDKNMTQTALKSMNEEVDSYYLVESEDDEAYLVSRENPSSEAYAQLYISFNDFKAACQKIKSVYSDNYDGYTNYMKFWARNGEYYWICNKDAHDEGSVAALKTQDGKSYVEIKKTYEATDFWCNYGSTHNLSPVDGKAWPDGKPLYWI